jgi:hypothetical protein
VIEWLTQLGIQLIASDWTLSGHGWLEVTCVRGGQHDLNYFTLCWSSFKNEVRGSFHWNSDICRAARIDIYSYLGGDRILSIVQVQS